MKELNCNTDKGGRRVSPDEEKLQYCGRIDFENTKEPVFIFPCSYVQIKFTGTTVRALVRNKRVYWNNYLGYILDGKQGTLSLPESGESCLTIMEGGDNKEHTLLLFKRMDSCHIFNFLGFLLDEDAEVLSLPPMPERRIEVFGDSISAGEVSEAAEYAGKIDPAHNGEYSNSWYSFAWMTARKLNARIHDIAQGGIALLNKTGWFCEPEYIGMEQVYDKLQYQPEIGVIKEWDFRQYTPHVVIVAIGQNDSHPEDYMAQDYQCRRSVEWRRKYGAFVRKLRSIYPDAVIILATSILRHDFNWDKSIEEVTQALKDEKIHHFIYSQNSVGTYGHIRSIEAERMSDELAAFINSLGETIWEERAK